MIKKCEICKKEFNTAREWFIWQKYCSAKCRNKAHFIRQAIRIVKTLDIKRKKI